MFNRPYLPPSFAQMCERVDEVAKYGEGPRKPLVKLLESFRTCALTYLHHIEDSSDLEESEDGEKDISEQAPDRQKKAAGILLGGWAACLEDIQSDYPRTSPDVITLFGYKLFGSNLFEILKNNLNISLQNQFDDKSRLIYLSALYNSLFSETENALDGDVIRKIFSDNDIDLEIVKKELKTSMAIVLNRMSLDIARLLKAVPTESVMTRNIDVIDLTYQEAKCGNGQYFAENEDRTFAVQFFKALSHCLLDLVEDDLDTEREEIPRSKRVRMGAALYIMHTINDEYYIRSATNSELYKILAAEILNVKHHDDLGHKTRDVCFEAFQSILHDPRLLPALEKYGREHYRNHNLLMHIDGRIHDIATKLEDMIKTQPASNWPMMHLFGYLGGLALMAPGYGFGMVAGNVANGTELSLQPKILAGRGINHIGKVLIGSAGGTLGFLAADFAIRNTLERLFAKVLETGGYIIGYGTGAAVGLVIDLSYKGLKKTCSYLLGKLDEVNDPTILENVDREFLECLLNLPDDILSFEGQQHLEKITGIAPQLTMSPQCEESEIYTYDGDEWEYCGMKL